MFVMVCADKQKVWVHVNLIREIKARPTVAGTHTIWFKKNLRGETTLTY